MCNGHLKENYSAHEPTYELNVDGSGESYDNVLESHTAKIKNLFGVTLLQNGTAKLTHCTEDTVSTESNCKPSAPSNRKKRELCEEQRLSIIHVESMFYDF